MSLADIIKEYPLVSENIKGKEPNLEYSAISVTMPQKAQLSGILYLKLLGVDGLLDLNSLHYSNMNPESHVSPSHKSYSGEKIEVPAKKFIISPKQRKMEEEKTEGVILPSLKHHENVISREKEIESFKSVTEMDTVGGAHMYKRENMYRYMNKTPLLKKHSLDQMDEHNGMFNSTI